MTRSCLWLIVATGLATGACGGGSDTATRTADGRYERRQDHSWVVDGRRQHEVIVETSYDPFDAEPTSQDTTRADRFYEQAIDAISSMRTLDDAVAAGYVRLVAFDNFSHLAHPTYSLDNKFDPAHPDEGVLASGRARFEATPQGVISAVIRGGDTPVVAGTWTVPVGQAAPDIAGPLTVWHAHETLTSRCFEGKVLPMPWIAPDSACPAGSESSKRTPEMIHAWRNQSGAARFSLDMTEAGAAE